MFCPSLNFVLPTQAYLPVPIAPLMFLLRINTSINLFGEHFDTKFTILIDSSFSTFTVLHKIINRVKSFSKEHFCIEFRTDCLTYIASSDIIDERSFKLKVPFTSNKRNIEYICQIQSQSFYICSF